MANLLLDDGTIEGDLAEITRELAPLGIELRHYDPGTSLLFPDMLAQDVLTESEKCYCVELHNSVFEFLQQENGTFWCDLLNLHPGSFNLHHLIATYGRYHTHPAPEPLYVLAGEMIYGFVRPDGSQIQLLVQAQDYLYIPAGVEHWCSPTALLNFKGIRYFAMAAAGCANSQGWVPNYTNTQVTDSLNNPG